MFGRNPSGNRRTPGKWSIRSRLSKSPEMAAILGIVAAPVAIGVACVAAWFTHVVVCLAAGKWGFLIAGAIMFPIAIVHGVMIWFGFGR